MRRCTRRCTSARGVRSGLWLPDSVEQWRVMVEEIGEQDHALESLDLLLVAAQIPEVRGAAAVLRYKL